MFVSCRITVKKKFLPENNFDNNILVFVFAAPFTKTKVNATKSLSKIVLFNSRFEI